MRCIHSNVVIVVVVAIDGRFQVETMLLMRLSSHVMRMMRVVRVMRVLMLTELKEVLRSLYRRGFGVDEEGCGGGRCSSIFRFIQPL